MSLLSPLSLESFFLCIRKIDVLARGWVMKAPNEPNEDFCQNQEARKSKLSKIHHGCVLTWLFVR